MKTTITIENETRSRINKAKYKLGHKTLDETINKIFDIVEHIVNAKQ
jgi:hypothetical protein